MRGAVSGAVAGLYAQRLMRLAFTRPQAAREKSVFVMVEFHKRFDPIYMDARAKARSFGDFGYVSTGGLPAFGM
jgi:hypothetical protein